MSKMVIRIKVGSKNPVKVGAAYQAFSQAFPEHVVHCEGMHAPSGVADQPMTEAETRLGAYNRAHYCLDMDTLGETDYFVAIEGGVGIFEEGAATYAYIAILKPDNTLLTGRSANLPLPSSVFKRLEAGEELGDVMDELFRVSNIKQKGGAIGLLTNNLATRESTYIQATILALAPALHPDIYQ